MVAEILDSELQIKNETLRWHDLDPARNGSRPRTRALNGEKGPVSLRLLDDGEERSQAEGSDLRWRSVRWWRWSGLSKGERGERSQMEGSGLRWGALGAISVGGVQSQGRASGLRRRGARWRGAIAGGGERTQVEESGRRASALLVPSGGAASANARARQAMQALAVCSQPGQKPMTEPRAPPFQYPFFKWPRAV